MPAAKVEVAAPVGGKQPIPVAGGMTPEGKAFHEGVLKTLNEMQAMQFKSQATLLKVKNDPAQLEAEINKLAAEAEKVDPAGPAAQEAPPGKEGQEYYAAFKALLDVNDESMDTELKMVLDVLRAPTPEGQQKLLKLASEKVTQQLQLMGRLTSAQQAFLNTANAAPANAAPANAVPASAPPAPPVAADPVQAAPAAEVKPAAVPAGWQPHSISGVFTVTAPPNPKREEKQGPRGEQVVNFDFPDGAGNTYTASLMSSIPEKLDTAVTIAAFYKGFGEGFARSSGATLGQQQQITVNGAKGQQYFFRNPANAKTVFVRAFLVGQDSVAVIYVMAGGATPQGDVLAFLDSFRLGK